MVFLQATKSKWPHAGWHPHASLAAQGWPRQLLYRGKIKIFSWGEGEDLAELPQGNPMASGARSHLSRDAGFIGA